MVPSGPGGGAMIKGQGSSSEPREKALCPPPPLAAANSDHETVVAFLCRKTGGYNVQEWIRPRIKGGRVDNAGVTP